MDHFNQIKGNLIDLNYPHIEIMQDSEIIDVLSTANRKFLIKWILLQIDHDCYNSFTDSELLEIITNYGFCMKSKKVKFITGDLPLLEQMDILKNMLQFAKRIKGQITSDDDAVSVDYLNRIINTDTNLFPVYGSRVTLSEDERWVRIEEFKKTIHHLEQLIAINANESDDGKKDSCNGNYEENVKKLQSLLGNFNKASVEHKKRIKIDPNQPKLIVDHHTLEECKILTMSIKQYLENIAVFTDLDDEPSTNLPANVIMSNAKLRSLILALHDVCDGNAK